MGVSFRVDFSVGDPPKNARAPEPARGHVYSDKQLVVAQTDSPAGISFSGEIDASNSHAVGSSIVAQMTPGKDLHVDVSQVIFCDISGIRAFVSVAEGLPEGRRLLLHGMPAPLETVMRVVGWNRLPALLVCECGSD
jgi:anti-anti-sigma regulatory factor